MQVPHLHTMITTPREVQKNGRFRIAFVLKQVHFVDAREVVVEADDIPLATMHMAHTCRVYVETDKMPGGGDLGSVRVRWNAVCLGPKALIAVPLRPTCKRVAPRGSGVEGTRGVRPRSDHPPAFGPPGRVTPEPAPQVSVDCECVARP